MNRRFLTPLAAPLAACLVFIAPTAGVAAAGATSVGSANADATDQLQEITVTAQKRTEDIKDIPFSVSAISGVELQEHHVADYDDITRALPGISFQAGPGPGLDTIEIRGVSSSPDPRPSASTSTKSR